MMLVPSLIFTNQFPVDGKAASYEQFGGEVSLFGEAPPPIRIQSAGYNQRSYDASNPILR